ncbi:hypothetical protein BDZ91DRAFT_761541 [Kalaharituber pfeilii]|nr:hypothetical protein BDZ91DRAFT_761541 [Kalaharituber pfeilii]
MTFDTKRSRGRQGLFNSRKIYLIVFVRRHSPRVPVAKQAIVRLSTAEQILCILRAAGVGFQIHPTAALRMYQESSDHLSKNSRYTVGRAREDVGGSKDRRRYILWLGMPYIKTVGLQYDYVRIWGVSWLQELQVAGLCKHVTANYELVTVPFEPEARSISVAR